LTSGEEQVEEGTISKEDTVDEDSHDVNNKSASETMEEQSDEHSKSDEHSSFQEGGSDSESSGIELKPVRSPRGRGRRVRGNRVRGSRGVASTSGVARRSRTSATRGKRTRRANSRSNKLTSMEEQVEEGTISKEDTVDEDSHDVNNKSASETMEEQSDEHSKYNEHRNFQE